MAEERRLLYQGTGKELRHDDWISQDDEEATGMDEKDRAEEPEQSDEGPQPEVYSIQQEIHYFVSDGKGERIGTLILLPHDYEHSQYWLSDVWTHPDHRGKGMASQILHLAIDNFGHKPIMLRSQPYAGAPLSRAQLEAIYAQHGFVAVPGAPGIMRREAGGPAEQAEPPSMEEAVYQGLSRALRELLAVNAVEIPEMPQPLALPHLPEIKLEPEEDATQWQPAKVKRGKG